MASCEDARKAGDDAQGRVFWREACRLFTEPHTVERVAYSDPSLPAFDDVVVYYRDGRVRVDGAPLKADCYQVKFRVHGSGQMTGQDLCDPGFVGRKGDAVLDDVRAMYDQGRNAGWNYRCTLYTPGTPLHTDALDSIWKRMDNTFDLKKLAEAGPRSRIGKMRAEWMMRLGLESVQELIDILQWFRIVPYASLQDLQEDLNPRLLAAGLAPIDAGELLNPYDQLVKLLVRSGKNPIGRDPLQTELLQVNLYRRPPIASTAHVTVGIRSFARRAGHYDTFDLNCCLLDLFDERIPRDCTCWNSDAPSRVEQFVSGLPTDGSRLLLSLASHLSVAFLFGYYLDSKSGVGITLVKNTPSGIEHWDTTPDLGADYADWVFSEEAVSEGDDVVVVMNVTHDIEDDVRMFLQARPFAISRFILCSLPDGPGDRAIGPGGHAAFLAGTLSKHIRASRSSRERRGIVHVFAAAPDGLMFLLGRTAHSLGRCQLYEYDMGTCLPGAYTPSVFFPIRTKSEGESS